MPSATLPYKVIVTNKSLGSTDGMGMASFDFLSLVDAENYAAQLRLSKVGSDYFNSYIYIWNGSGEVLTEYSPLDGDFTDVIDAAVTASETIPSNKVINATDTLIKALKAGANTWGEFDAFYLFATDGDSDFATYNIVNESANRATKVDSPTFTKKIGFNGDGSSSYLDLNIDPTAPLTNYLRDDASFGVYSWDDIDTVSTFSYPIAQASRVRLYKSSADALNRINNSSYTPQDISTSGTGLIGMTRPSSTEFFGLSSDGTLGSSNSASSVALSQSGNFFINRYASNYRQGRIGLAWIGGNLSSTQWSEFVSAVNTYITSIS